VEEGAPELVNAPLAQLGAIREALTAHDSPRALRMLDDFDRQFPASNLSEEVTVLRIDALVDSGRLVEASNLASRFLKGHPKSAYGEHVGSKIQSPIPSPR
jgi:outer membrane protein assembly factor BamD (BamD/ComL family)